MPRMRTASGVLATIKEQDPGTEITLYFIRGIINSGAVPVVHAGTKKLVDVDRVIKYIASGGECSGASKPVKTGQIRRVDV